MTEADVKAELTRLRAYGEANENDARELRLKLAAATLEIERLKRYGSGNHATRVTVAAILEAMTEERLKLAAATLEIERLRAKSCEANSRADAAEARVGRVQALINEAQTAGGWVKIYWQALQMLVDGKI